MMVIPHPPGGSADIVARLIVDNGGEELGKSIFVTNCMSDPRSRRPTP